MLEEDHLDVVHRVGCWVTEKRRRNLARTIELSKNLLRSQLGRRADARKNGFEP